MQSHPLVVVALCLIAASTTIVSPAQALTFSGCGPPGGLSVVTTENVTALDCSGNLTILPGSSFTQLYLVRAENATVTVNESSLVGVELLESFDNIRLTLNGCQFNLTSNAGVLRPAVYIGAAAATARLTMDSCVVSGTVVRYGSAVMGTGGSQLLTNSVVAITNTSLELQHDGTPVTTFDPIAFTSLQLASGTLRISDNCSMFFRSANPTQTGLVHFDGSTLTGGATLELRGINASLHATHVSLVVVQGDAAEAVVLRNVEAELRVGQSGRLRPVDCAQPSSACRVDISDCHIVANMLPGATTTHTGGGTSDMSALVHGKFGALTLTRSTVDLRAASPRGVSLVWWLSGGPNPPIVVHHSSVNLEATGTSSDVSIYASMTFSSTTDGRGPITIRESTVDMVARGSGGGTVRMISLFYYDSYFDRHFDWPFTIHRSTVRMHHKAAGNVDMWLLNYRLGGELSANISDSSIDIDTFDKPSTTVNAFSSYTTRANFLVVNTTVRVASEKASSCYAFRFHTLKDAAVRQHNFSGSTISLSCAASASPRAIVHMYSSPFGGTGRVTVDVTGTKLHANASGGASVVAFDMQRYVFSYSAGEFVVKSANLEATASCNADAVPACSATAVQFTNSKYGMTLDLSSSRLTASGGDGVYGVKLPAEGTSGGTISLDDAVINVTGGNNVVGVHGGTAGANNARQSMTLHRTQITAVAYERAGLSDTAAACVLFTNSLGRRPISIQDAVLTAEARTMATQGAPSAVGFGLRDKYYEAFASLSVTRSVLSVRVGNSTHIAPVGFASAVMMYVPPDSSGRFSSVTIRLQDSSNVTVAAANATGLIFVRQDPAEAPAVRMAFAYGATFACTGSKITVIADDECTGVWLPYLSSSSTFQMQRCAIHTHLNPANASTARAGVSFNRGVFVTAAVGSTVVIEEQSEIKIFGTPAVGSASSQRLTGALVVTGQFYESSVDIRDNASLTVEECNNANPVITAGEMMESLAALIVAATSNTPRSRVSVTRNSTLGVTCDLGNTSAGDHLRQLYASAIIVSPVGSTSTPTNAYDGTAFDVLDSWLFVNMTVPATAFVVRWLVTLPPMPRITLSRSSLAYYTSASQVSTSATAAFVRIRSAATDMDLTVSQCNFSAVGSNAHVMSMASTSPLLLMEGYERCNLTLDSNFGRIMKPTPLASALVSLSNGEGQRVHDSAVTLRNNAFEVQSGVREFVSTPSEMVNVTIELSGNYIRSNPTTRGATTPAWPGYWIEPSGNATRLSGTQNAFSSTCDKYDSRVVTTVDKFVNVSAFVGAPLNVSVTPCSATPSISESTTGTHTVTTSMQTSSRTVTKTMQTSSHTDTVTRSTTASHSATLSRSRPSPTVSISRSSSAVPTASLSFTITRTLTATPSDLTATGSGTQSRSRSISNSPSRSGPTVSGTASSSSTASTTSSVSLNGTHTRPLTVTGTLTNSRSDTVSLSLSSSPTRSLSVTMTLSLSSTLTLLVPLPPPPPREPEAILEPARITVTASVVASSALGSPVTAVQASRSNLLVTMQSCEMDMGEELDSMTSPTGFALGTSPVRYYAGAALMNILIVLGFFAFGLFLAVVRRVYLVSHRRAMLARRAIRAAASSDTGTSNAVAEPLVAGGILPCDDEPTHDVSTVSEEDPHAAEDEHYRIAMSLRGCLSWARCPNFQMFPVLFLLQPTATCAVAVLRYLPFGGHETEHLAAICAVVLTSLAVVWILCTVVFQLPKCAQFVPVAPPNTDGKQATRGPLSRFWAWFTYEDGEWVDRIGNEKYVNQFGSFFDEFIGKAGWFMSVEVIFSFVLGLLAPIATGAGCFPVAVTTVVCYLFYVVMLFGLRPHTAWLNFAFALTMGSIQLLTGIVVTAVTYTQAEHSTARSAIDYIGAFGMFLAVVKTIYDTIMFIYRRLENILRNPNTDEEKSIMESTAPVDLMGPLGAMDMDCADDPRSGDIGAPDIVVVGTTQAFDVGDAGAIPVVEDEDGVFDEAVKTADADDPLAGLLDVAHVNHVAEFDIGGAGLIPVVEDDAGSEMAADDTAADGTFAEGDLFAGLLSNVDRGHRRTDEAVEDLVDTTEGADLAAVRLAAISAVFGARTTGSAMEHSRSCNLVASTTRAKGGDTLDELDGLLASSAHLARSETTSATGTIHSEEL